MMVNIPLLRKAVEWVEEEAAKPKSVRAWYQGSWARVSKRTAKRWTCGSTTCLAGHVVMMDGWFPAVDNADVCSDGMIAVEYVEKNGVVRSIQGLAADLLGITLEAQGGLPHLFEGDNDAEMIRTIAEHLAGERL